MPSGGRPLVMRPTEEQQRAALAGHQARTQRFVRGELTPDEWRPVRLSYGLYYQLDHTSHMQRIKIPGGILSVPQMNCLNDIADLYERRERLGLDREQARLLERTYLAFVRAGAKLGPKAKKRVAEINTRMATLAPYNEFAVMVPVRYGPDWNIPFLPLLDPDHYDVGFWVHHLPVTTQEACDVGIGVWGFPKVVAEIEFRDVGWVRECDVWEDGEHVLTLSSAMGETRREARRFYAYSVLEGELVKTLVDTRGEYYAWNVPGRASFELGTHRVADELRDLEVQNFAIAGLFTFSTRSRLHPGTAVAAIEPAAAGFDGL